MIVRKKILTHLFYLIILLNYCFPDIIINRNTTWSQDKYLTESVIIKPSGSLSIDPGVNVYIKNDTYVSNNEGISILVLGSLSVLGTINEPVYIGPKLNSNNKSYWSGIKFDSTQVESNISFLTISNAHNGLDIRSSVNISNSVVQLSGNHGVYVKSASTDSILFQNVRITKCDDVSFFIDRGNVELNWIDISKGKRVGLVNNTFGSVLIDNLKITDHSDNGIMNYGHLNASNIFISKNRHGIVLSPGISIITNAKIVKNRANGLLIGGGSNADMEYCTIEKNGGFGIELSDWSQNDYYSNWEFKNQPYIKITNSNFIDNYKSFVLDDHEYQNIWSSWEDVEYSGSGWVDNFEVKLKRKVPFGRLSWVGFSYNSNVGSDEFSWQPCTGKSVWSPIFEIQNSREQTVTYMDAPFQCGWNPLAGKNSNFWFDYEKYTGLIDSTEKYSDWSISKMDLPSSNEYYLRHHFSSTYLPKSDSLLTVKPVVKDFKLRFYHGGQEISSYALDNRDVNLSGNYWSSSIKNNKLINSYGETEIEVHNRSDSIIINGTSIVQNDASLSIVSPKKGLAYQEVKLVDIVWDTEGWVPLVNLFVSTDGGKKWEIIATDIINNGSYSWWNNLIVGDNFLIKIVDSSQSQNSAIIGPCKVIVNKTPVLKISTKTLNFTSDLSKMKLPIINNGGGILFWTLSANEKWIYFDKLKGSAKKKSNPIVSVKRSGLKTGKYLGEVFIKSNVGVESVDVNLIVSKPSLYVDTKYISFDSLKTDQTFSIKNYGGGTLTWSIDPGVSWLKIIPNEGVVQSATTVKILLDRSRLKIGDNEVVLTLNTNVGEKNIDVNAHRTKSFIKDTIRTDFNPWHWMYKYDVY